MLFDPPSLEKPTYWTSRKSPLQHKKNNTPPAIINHSIQTIPDNVLLNTATTKTIITTARKLNKHGNIIHHSNWYNNTNHHNHQKDKMGNTSYHLLLRYMMS